MKNVNQTLAATVVVSAAFMALTAGTAFAEMVKLEDPLADFNFNIGVEEPIIPDHVDIELVSRICVNELDTQTCLGESLQQVVER